MTVCQLVSEKKSQHKNPSKNSMDEESSADELETNVLNVRNSI